MKDCEVSQYFDPVVEEYSKVTLDNTIQLLLRIRYLVQIRHYLLSILRRVNIREQSII